MIGCVVWLMCVCWLTVSSSLGLREINPRQRPHCLYRLTGFTPRQRPSRSTTNKQPTHTHTFNQPCIHPSTQPSVRPLTHIYLHPSIQPLIHPNTHLSTRPNHPPSIHPPSIRPPKCNRMPRI